VKTTKADLKEIRNALIVYALTNDRLPCPDTNDVGHDDEGVENVTGGNCDTDAAYLPWVTLGVGRRDVWNNRYLYRVDENYQNAIPDDGITDDKISVQEYGTGTELTKDDGSGESPLVALILSCGQNDVPDDSNKQGTTTSCEHTGNNTYVSGALHEDVFDDLLIWLPKNILLYHLLVAEKWRGS